MKSHSQFHKAKQVVHRKWIALGIAIIVLGGGTAWGLHYSNAAYEYVETTKGNIQEGVVVKGTVTPTTEVNLSFDNSGLVKLVSKAVGETVTAGDVIVKLDTTDLINQRNQTSQALALQQIKLANLQKNAVPTSIASTTATIVATQSELDVHQTSLLTALKVSYSIADDAIRNKIDELFINPQSLTPQLIVSNNDLIASTIISGRVEVEKRLLELQTLSQTTSTSTITQNTPLITQDLAEIKLFLDNLDLYLNGLPQNYSSSQGSITQWRTDLAEARTEVNTGITSILASQNAYRQARTTLTNLQNQLVTQQSGPASKEIQQTRSSIVQLQVALASIDAQIARQSLISPINGLIVKQDARLGTIAPSSTPLVSIINDGQYDIEANVPQTEISKIKIGQKAKIVLDAYPSTIEFEAVVVTMSPTETMINSIPHYNVTFQFTTIDDRIKSGMTATVSTVGEYHQSVLIIPEQAVITKDGKQFALVKLGNEHVEAQIITGLRGSDGMVEITSGLQDGDEVVVKRK